MPDRYLIKEWTSGKIVLIYIIIGCLWIFLSDEILVWFGGETGSFTYYQTFKGCFFVLATAGMLYILINRAMQTIRDSEAARQDVSRRYTELVENANDVIFTLSLKGQFTSINRSGEKIFGYSRNELLDLNLEDLVIPKYKQLVRRSFRNSKEEIPIIYEAEFVKKDGGQVLLEVSSRQICQDENIIGFQGIARNISERRVVEESLKQSETRYHDLIATANEGIIILNNEGLITFVNQKMCEMLDYDAEELLENYIFDFMNDETKIIVQQKIEHQRNGFKERFDLKFRKLDGTDLWTSISASPILKNRKYVGSLGMITDISERKIAEDALRQEKYISDSIIDSLPGVFYLYDKDGKFLRWNRNFERVTGYSAKEMESRHPLDFFTGEEKDLLERKIKEVFDKGEETVKANFVSKDGTQTPYFFTGKKIMLGNLECLVGMGIDISNRPS